MRVGQSSSHRSQAAQLAYDMVDRIRVNFAHAAAYDTALNAPTPTASSCNGVVACLDVVDWRERLRLLPGGTGSVAINGSEVTVVVQWDDSRGAGGAATAQFQLTAQLAQ